MYKLDEVTAIIETIKTASEISLDKVNADNLEQIEVALGAIDVIQGNLSHEQKTTVSGYGELLTKLKDKIGEVATYLTNLELLSQKQGLEVTNIKTSDVSQLNEAKTLIDNFPYQEGILNAEQKNKYNTVYLTSLLPHSLFHILPDQSVNTSFEYLEVFFHQYL